MPGLHTETVAKEKEHALEPGRQLKQAIQLIALHQQKRLAELSLSMRHAARQDVQLVIEVIAHGGHGGHVAKENRLELELGLL